SSSRSPSSMFVSAAAFLIIPIAAMKSREKRRSLIGKFSTARCVCAPHSASAGTFISPSESFSILKLCSLIRILPRVDLAIQPASHQAAHNRKPKTVSLPPRHRRSHLDAAREGTGGHVEQVEHELRDVLRLDLPLVARARA